MILDPMFAAEMAYIGPKGIPYSTWREWDDLSRSAALAWQARESQRCSGCGTVTDDWRERDWDGNPLTREDGSRYDAWPQPFAVEAVQCPGCELLADHRKADTPPGGHLPGHVHHVFRENPDYQPVMHPQGTPGDGGRSEHG